MQKTWIRLLDTEMKNNGQDRTLTSYTPNIQSNNCFKDAVLPTAVPLPTPILLHSSVSML
eukprot:m.57130 g.57130  ORF g.57130 m.57130 type:complete len:60 (+) comp11216_c0_seq2:408-587(+)